MASSLVAQSLSEPAAPAASGVTARRTASAAKGRLMAGIAAVANVAGPEIGVRQLRNDAVHATAAAMDGAMVPARGQDDAEVDRAGAGRLVDRRHRTVDHALRGGRALASAGAGVQTAVFTVTAATGSPIADAGMVPIFSDRAVGLGDHLVRAERRQLRSGRLNRRRGRRLRTGPSGQQASRGKNESQGGHARTAANHVGLSQGEVGACSETLPSDAGSDRGQTSVGPRSDPSQITPRRSASGGGIQSAWIPRSPRITCAAL